MYWVSHSILCCKWLHFTIVYLKRQSRSGEAEKVFTPEDTTNPPLMRRVCMLEPKGLEPSTY